MTTDDQFPASSRHARAPHPQPAPSRELRVILILADSALRGKLATFLRNDGFLTEEFECFDAAIAHISNGLRIDAMLIEVGEGQPSCKDMVIQLRRSGIDAPIAMASPRYSESDEVSALAHGAADYMSLSRRASIIGRRIQLLAEGVKNVPGADDTASEVISMGSLELRMQSHRASWRNQPVPLTVTEFKIVRLLACRSGQGASYREIYDVVHGVGFIAGEGPEGHRNNVRSLIRNVRARFRSIDPPFSEIENLPGHGYRWRQPTPVESDLSDVRHPEASLEGRLSHSSAA